LFVWASRLRIPSSGLTTAFLKSVADSFTHPSAEAVTATVHPSATLRSPDPDQRQLDYKAFVKDLIGVRERLHRKTKSA
jgi:hypothetical protein